MNTDHFEISDCWSSEQQPTTYYRIAAARARRLHADATTPSVKQYLDRMIAHCERLASKVEPCVLPGPDGRSAGMTRMARNPDRLPPGSRRTLREKEGAASFKGPGWMKMGTGLGLTERTV
jgi:hypothetical protein